MSDLELPPVDFSRRFFADHADLVAARWWHHEVQKPYQVPEVGELKRRDLLIAIGGATAFFLLASRIGSCDQDGDEPNVSMDALELQRGRGWDVGAAGEALRYPGASAVDVEGTANWRQGLDVLVGEIAPSQDQLTPFYVPTLFQVASDQGFQRTLSPIHDDEMDGAFARGRALADLFADVPDPSGTALLIDAPGPQAVAAAAGLAERFDPVFLFDNWPHPRGVVPSHQVIAAALYYRPTLIAARARRPVPAPPVFVIDDRRLAPYGEQSDAFDNRYLARFPSAQALRIMGISHLLYVTSAPVAHEADDLNDDFTAIAQGGIDVKLVALSDFRARALSNVYSYGGSDAPHLYFWRSYGWYHLPQPPAGARPPVVFSDGASFRPTPRATIFSSRTVGGLGGVGKQKPSGFGRVSVRTSRTGAVSVGRSGSLGRTRFGGGG